MIITLTPDIEKVLVEQAHKLGTAPEQLALKSLRERFVLHVSHTIPTERQDTLVDFLSGHIGVLHSSEHIPGGARMSEESGKKFAAGLVAQHQQSSRDPERQQRGSQ